MAKPLQLLRSLSLRQRRPWSAASLLLVLTQQWARQVQLAACQLLKAPWLSSVWLAPSQTLAMPQRQQGQRSVLGSSSQRCSQLLARQAGKAGLGPGRLLPRAANPLLLRQQPLQRSVALSLIKLLRRQLPGR